MDDLATLTQQTGNGDPSVTVRAETPSDAFARRPPAPAAAGDGDSWEVPASHRLSREDLQMVGGALAMTLIGPPELTAQEARLTFLGVEESSLHEVTAQPQSPIQSLCGALLILREVSNAAWTHGTSPTSPPAWRSVPMPSGPTQIPRHLVAAMPAGTICPAPVVVSFAEQFQDPPVLTVWSSTADAEVVNQWSGRFFDRALAGANPYRMTAIEVDADFSSTRVEPLTLGHEDPEDLILDEAIWRNVGDEILSLLDRAHLLSELRLGARRGVLLVGPPGVGKTKLVRVLASELVGRVSVLIATSDAIRMNIHGLYSMACDLAPALVILDDIDLVVGERGGRSGERGGIHELLAALDGAVHSDAGIVTIATTNDALGIDRALTRPSRFDRIIEIGHPRYGQRRRMIRTFLARLADRVDADVVAKATDGMTGAELKELARLAVLRHGEEITTERLLAGLHDLADSTRLRTGQYL